MKNLKIGQKFKHFDGKDYCVCVITEIIGFERVYLAALTDYFTVRWWDTRHSFENSSPQYYYELLPHYKSKLGKILYK